jgi:hypothetical protein
MWLQFIHFHIYILKKSQIKHTLKTWYNQQVGVLKYSITTEKPSNLFHSKSISLCLSMKRSKILITTEAKFETQFFGKEYFESNFLPHS